METICSQVVLMQPDAAPQSFDASHMRYRNPIVISHAACLYHCSLGNILLKVCKVLLQPSISTLDCRLSPLSVLCMNLGPELTFELSCQKIVLTHRAPTLGYPRWICACVFCGHAVVSAERDCFGVKLGAQASGLFIRLTNNAIYESRFDSIRFPGHRAASALLFKMTIRSEPPQSSQDPSPT